MRIHRRWRLVLSLLDGGGICRSGARATAQHLRPPAPAPGPPAGQAETEAQTGRCGAGRDSPRPSPRARRRSPPRPRRGRRAGGAQPKLLGQYGDWGAYTASPGGKKVCFAIAKPTSAQTVPPNRPRNPVYMFISTRPADKVANEVSIIVGYPFKPSTEATAAVGSTSFALYTQQDGAWIKNAAEEANMIDAMRAGDRGGEGRVGERHAIDRHLPLKGISQALDRDRSGMQIDGVRS